MSQSWTNSVYTDGPPVCSQWNVILKVSGPLKKKQFLLIGIIHEFKDLKEEILHFYSKYSYKLKCHSATATRVRQSFDCSEHIFTDSQYTGYVL